MALENLVRLAERISSLPDEALAQIAQTEGIEPVIAASELKNRQDIRAEAAAQPQQNPSVVEQLIQRAMGQQQQPQGMPQQGMQQQGMPQQMPPQMPPQGPPQMPPQMPPQGPPMASMGGLLRRFATGDLVPSPFEEDFFETYGVTPEDAAGGPMSSEALEQMRSAYEEEWNKPLPGAYNLALQSAPVTTTEYDVSQVTPEYGGQQGVPGYGGMPPGRPTLRQLQPVEREEIANQAEQQAKRAAATKRIREMKFEGDKQMVPGRMEERYSPTERGKVERTFIEAGDPSGGLAPRERDPLIPITDASIGPSGGGQAQADDKTTDKKTPPPQQAEYQRRVGIIPDQSLYHMSRRGDLLRTAGAQFLANANQDLISLGRVSDPHSTELSKKLSKLDADDMKRMQGYNDEIDKYLGELDELEKDIPDRQSIKDRFKKQIDYGLAQAFFSAAEKGSPDFMTAMAGSMAGASEVMNKMTGQEQKELYKHATDAFTRKASRANASFKQRTELGKQIKDRAATTATTRTNAIAARRLQLDAADKQIQRNISIYDKAMASAKNAADIDKAGADHQRNTEADYTRAWTTLVSDTTTGIISPAVQHQRFLGPGYAMLGGTSAQRVVNEGLRHNFKELWKLKGQAEKDPEIADPVQNAMREYMKQLRDGDQTTYGDLALMNRYATEIMAALQLGGTPDGALSLLQSSHPWMNLPMTGGDVD